VAAAEVVSKSSFKSSTGSEYPFEVIKNGNLVVAIDIPGKRIERERPLVPESLLRVSISGWLEEDLIASIVNYEVGEHEMGQKLDPSVFSPQKQINELT
jgi:hypothetical protein